MGKKLYFIVLVALVFFGLFLSEPYIGDGTGIDKGDTTWVLVASAFVLLMTLGLAFFTAEWRQK
jgi:Amt family ammonium transporter